MNTCGKQRSSAHRDQRACVSRGERLDVRLVRVVKGASQCLASHPDRSQLARLTHLRFGSIESTLLFGHAG